MVLLSNEPALASPQRAQAARESVGYVSSPFPTGSAGAGEGNAYHHQDSRTLGSSCCLSCPAPVDMVRLHHAASTTHTNDRSPICWNAAASLTTIRSTGSRRDGPPTLKESKNPYAGLDILPCLCREGEVDEQRASTCRRGSLNGLTTISFGGKVPPVALLGLLNPAPSQLRRAHLNPLDLASHYLVWVQLHGSVFPTISSLEPAKLDAASAGPSSPPPMNNTTYLLAVTATISPPSPNLCYFPSVPRSPKRGLTCRLPNRPLRRDGPRKALRSLINARYILHIKSPPAWSCADPPHSTK